MKISTIIVTYNRKNLLSKCIDAVLNQSYKSDRIYVIDNASTDGTGDYINVLLQEHSNIKYQKLLTNTGGAGGFYYGLKWAYEDGISDAFWVMDDDGEPEKYCLENLIRHINDYVFLSPLVLNIDNKKETSFRTIGITDVDEIKKMYPHGLIECHANPFNGVILQKCLIEKIGLPKKELFIWGDENEYEARIIYNGIKYATVIDAIHYHPKDRLVVYKDFLGRKNIIYVDSKLRRYCKYRNTAYILKTYKGFFNVVFYVMRYTFYYLFNRKLDFPGLNLYYLAVKDGLNENFSNHVKYIS